MTRSSGKPAKHEFGDTRPRAEHRLLVQEEIWRVVSQAAETCSALSVRRQAQEILDTFPECGCSLQSISDALVFSAVDVGATVEVRPGRRALPEIDVQGFLPFVRKRRRQKGAPQPVLVEGALHAPF
jgi:hypothetical protein